MAFITKAGPALRHTLRSLASWNLGTTMALALCLCGMQVGCGGGSSSKSKAPSSLQYPQTSIVTTVGMAITTDTPTVTGTVTSYAVTPALPTGLTLNASTGAISGTATAVSAQAGYTVTASNSTGSTTASIQITVSAAPPVITAPSGLQYPQGSIIATVGTAIATDTPTVTGTVATYAVSPALPAGLSLSSTTGAISGTPTAASAQTSYTVIASNTSGSTTAVVQITVNAAMSAPASLSYATPLIAAIEGEAITTDIPTVTGLVTLWSVAPQLPAGLTLNAATGAISGTPSVVVASSGYTVTAANAVGSTTAVIQIGVVTASVNQAIHATFVSGHQSFHAALNYTYTPLNFALPSTSPIKASLAQALRSHLRAAKRADQSGPTVSFNDDLGLYQTDVIQNGNTAAINYYLDAAATMPAGATSLTFPNGLLAGSYPASSYPVTIPITQNITGGKIPCVGSGSIVVLDAAGKNTINGSLTLTNDGLTVTASISLDDNLNVTGNGTILENGETITVTGMTGPFTGNVAGAAVLTPQNYNGTANISIADATFSAVFNTPNGVGTCSSANGILSIQYPDGSTETLTDPNDTQPNAPPVPTTGGPTNLSYALATISATQGQVIVNDTPAVTGTVTAWSINPALPAGLTIDPTSGIISGTPTVISSATSYVITASNASGFTQGTVQITVAPGAAPSGLSYPQDLISATAGTAIASDTPTVTGIVTSWTVSPALPAGITLDPSSGIISGTPTTASAETAYTITAANGTGSTITTVTITVSPAPTGPVTITYPITNIVTNEDQAIAPDVPVVTGAASGFVADPPLPYGMSIDPNTGIISGTPATQLPVSTFNIFAQQVEGPVATIQLTVNEAPVQGIAAQDAVFTNSTLNLASFASTTAQTFQWTLTDQTASGTITAGATSDLIQYTAGATAGNYQLNVVTQAASGNSTTATRTLHVVSDQFLKDPTSSWDRGIASASQLANGSILFVGGASTSNTATYSTEVFDPVSQTFSTTAQLNTIRSIGQAQVTLSNGKVLVCGGQTPYTANGSQILASAEIYDPSADTWTTVASMNAARGWHTATLLQNGKVLVTGGEDNSGNVLGTAEMYDPVANIWTPVSSLNAARDQHAAILLPNGSVIVVGGSALVYNADGAQGVATTEIYSPSANTWTVTGSLETPRVQNTTTLLSTGKVLVTGGTDNNFNPLNSAEIYGPTAGSWSYTAVMNESVFTASAALLPNGQVLVAGGQAGSTFFSDYNPIASAEIYDPVANTWTNVASMNVPRYSQYQAVLPNGNVLVAYGACLGFNLGECNLISEGFSESVGTAETYNVAANTWTALGMVMQLAGYNTQQYTLGIAATQFANGELLLTGGISDTGTGPANTAQLFNPATNSWTIAAPMNTARANHTETLLQNGQVLVTGGDVEVENSSVQYSSVLSSAEIYDPVANTWTAVANLLTARTSHTATLLPNGQVLVAGGLDSNGNLVPTAELYDPTSQTWSPAGSMITPRYQHTATLLNTGQVLVAGGSTNTTGVSFSVATSAAELYDPSTNTWSAAPAMPTAVLSHTATLLANGTVAIIGGSSGGAYGAPSPVAGVMLYNPTTNAWSQLASLNQPRASHAATLLSNGQILVTGGYGEIGAVSQSELYTPSTNTWTLDAPLNLPRYLHFAFPFSDGRVMIVGGTPGYIPEFWKQ